MPAIFPEEVADFVENTLRTHKTNAWADISLDLQEYFAMSNLLLPGKVGYDGGERLQWQVKVRNSNAAKVTAPFDEDTANTVNVMKHASVGWSYQQTQFHWEDREIKLQGSYNRTKILDLVQIRRHAALCDFAELMEELWWGVPSGNDRR